MRFTKITTAFILAFIVGLSVSTVGQEAVPTPALRPAELTDAQKAAQSEVIIANLQSQLAQKDQMIAQLLNENAQYRIAAAQTKTQEVSQNLVKKAGGDPAKDTWDFQTMKLVKAPPPTPPK